MSSKNYVIVGDTMSNACRQSLRQLGFEPIILPPYKRLGKQVATHADLLIFPTGGEIFTFGEYAKALPSLVGIAKEKRLCLRYVKALPDKKYPNDVLLNCLAVGDRIFSRVSSTAEEITEYAKSKGIKTVNVKQGYARCTACPISKDAVVTADSSIAKAAESEGLDVLRISEGSVTLEGYAYGFIGGACGVFKDNIYFAGDLLSHPDGKAIAHFCRRHGISAVSLSTEPLRDVGSMFFI